MYYYIYYTIIAHCIVIVVSITGAVYCTSHRVSVCSIDGKKTKRQRVSVCRRYTRKKNCLLAMYIAVYICNDVCCIFIYFHVRE